MKTACKWLAALTALCGSGFTLAAEEVPATTGANIVQMEDLDGFENITCFDDNGKTKARKHQDTLGNALTIKGNTYASGVGTHAPSKAVVDLKGATDFYTIIGVTDGADVKADHGVVDYTVTLYKDHQAEVKGTGTVTRQGNDEATISLSGLADYDYLVLDFATGTNAWADHCAWADARFVYSGEKPVLIVENEMYYDPSKIVELPKAGPDGERIIPLSSLDLSNVTNGWGSIKKDKSIDNNALTMKGITYTSGIGMHATAKMVIRLNGAVSSFHAVTGIDDEVKAQSENNTTQGICDYRVILRAANGDETVKQEGTIRYLDTEAVTIDIDNLEAYKYLILEYPEGAQNGNDHVDLGCAYFVASKTNTAEPVTVPESALSAALKCAKTLFAQPGVRFMHKIRSDNEDVTITAEGLPAGLTWNAKRNLVEGIVEQEGEYTYTIKGTTSGEDAEESVETISLTVSSKLIAPTPSMGWMSWNAVQGDISEDVVKTVVAAMEKYGLIEAGYNRISLDDHWHGTREPGTNKPRPNATRFPNGIKALADFVHSKGMRLGVYSDAAGSTCAGEFGSYGYETIDANTYAEWGVDYLKYDYCHADNSLNATKTRYKAMGDALKASGRDIEFNVCEWGQNDPYLWGAEVGGHSWRISHDVRDGWSGRGNGIGVVQSMRDNKDIAIYTNVSRFNDADMLCTGLHGTGKSSNDLVQGTPGMTMDEYTTQFALWCMWSSPLNLTVDLRKSVNAEDVALMTNPELIALNQDRMCQGAEFLGADNNDMYLLVKDLENGDVAVSVTNMSSAAHPYTIDFSKIDALDPTATYSVRNAVDRKDEADAIGSIGLATVPSHATKVFRLHNRANDVLSIADVTTDAIGKMTARTEGNEVTICMPGTEGATKRLLISNMQGNIIAAASTQSECHTLKLNATKGVYVVNAVCGGRAHSVKITL